MSNKILGLILCMVPMAYNAGYAQDRLGELAIDTVATDLIREATTDAEFLTRWVDALPEHPTVPSPRDVLGYTIGTPG